jgi:hypothetical protein
MFAFVIIFFNGCKSTPEIIHKNFEYEKIVLDNYRFTFEIHLENFKYPIKVSELIKKLIYQNNTFDEYISFIENKFIENISKENFPTIINDDETEYIYRSYLNETYNVEYYNDLFVIIKYFAYIYYSGMVHGNYMFKYFVIDLNNKRILEINDLIYQVPDELLKEIIQNKYKIDYYLRENIWPPDTISFKKDSIVLMWNIYTITPYVNGPIELNIQDKIIESYFTEKGITLKNSMKINN